MKRRLPIELRPATLGALVILTLAAGCDRDGVKVYHVETNDTATTLPATTTAASASAMPGAMPSSMPAGLPAPDNSGLPKLKYTLPDGWQEKAPSQMRVASFAVSESGKSVDISVVPLVGMGGGDFANVNRWRGQLELQLLDDGAIQTLAEKVTVAGQPADLYDLGGTATAGNEAQRIIAVILHRDEAVWFFKMIGEAALAEKQKPAFISFLQSARFDAPATSALAGTTTEVSNDQPTWTIPPGWQAGPPSQFLVAKYIIAGPGEATADVNISSATGDGRDPAANVNRWRGQLGLPASPELLTSPLDLPGGKAEVVDFSGTDDRSGKAARLIGVMVSQGAQTWFYKLMGDPDLVAQQKEAFTRFVQSAKYPDVH